MQVIYTTDRRRFVYDTYNTMKATRICHGWVHMFTTHRPTLTLELHNFDLFRTCRTALLRGNWQDFNWHDASRGPSAIAELLVNCFRRHCSRVTSIFTVIHLHGPSHGHRLYVQKISWSLDMWLLRYASGHTYTCTCRHANCNTSPPSRSRIIKLNKTPCVVFAVIRSSIKYRRSL